MRMLDFNDLDDIIETLKDNAKYTKNILEEQSTTIFHTKDYYEGALKVYEEIIPMLKIYQSKEDKIIDNIVEKKRQQDKELEELCKPRVLKSATF